MKIEWILIYQFLWYFIIYSFLGWVVEVAFQAVKRGKIINRGFLNGPVCPVYGFGVVGIVMLTDSLEGHMNGDLNIGILFGMGVVIATAIELLAGWALDMLFHARWWDYSNQKLNFRGYICLRFSLIWGAAIVLVIKLMQPAVKANDIWEKSQKYGWPILVCIYLFYLADLIVTVAIVRKMNRQLQELDQIQSSMRIVSNRLSEVVGGTTLKATQKIEEGQVQAALATAELKEAASQKKEELTEAVVQKKTELTEAAVQKKTELTEAAVQKKVELTEAAVQKRVELTEAAVQKRVELTEAAVQKKVELTEAAVQKRVELTEAAVQKKTELTERKDLLVEAAYNYRDETTESLVKRKEALQKRADEIMESMMRGGFGAKRLLKAFPRMVPSSYKDAWAALREKAHLGGRHSQDSDLTE